MRKTVAIFGLVSIVCLAGCSKVEVQVGDLQFKVDAQKETIAEEIPEFDTRYFDRIVAYDKDGIKIVAENLVYEDSIPHMCMTFSNTSKMKQKFVSQTITVNNCIIPTEKEYEVEPNNYTTVNIPITGLSKYGIDGSKNGNIEDIELDILVYAVQDKNRKIPIDFSGYTAESGTIYINLVDEKDKTFKYDAKKGLVAYDKNGIELVVTDMYWDKETNLPVLNMYAHNYGDSIRVLAVKDVTLNDNLVISQCKTIIDPNDYLVYPLRLDTVDWNYWKEYYKDEGNTTFVEDLDFFIGSIKYIDASTGANYGLEKVHIDVEDVETAKIQVNDSYLP